MGQTTLEQFRNRLGVVLKGEGIENDTRDLWINSGYFEVVGSVAFDKFKEDMEFTFNADEFVVEIPERVMSVLALFDLPAEKEVLYANPEVFRKFIRGLGYNEVRNWTQIGNELFIWDTPSADLTLSGVVLVEPEKMEAPSDTTDIPTTWDEAVFLLAAEKALLDLEQEERSLKYGQRAIAYMGSRLRDGDFSMRRQGEGLSIAYSENDLRSMRRY